MSHHFLRTVALGLGLTLTMTTLVAGPARAGWREEENEKYLGHLERTFDEFVKSDEHFAGTVLKPGVNVRGATKYVDRCMTPIATFDQQYSRIDKAGQASARGRKLVDRYNALAAYCKALGKAIEDHEAGLKAAAKASEAKGKADSQMCYALTSAAHEAVGKGNNVGFGRLHDIYSGMMTLNSAESFAGYRASLEQLAAVCAKPEFANSATRCIEHGTGNYRIGTTTTMTDSRHICVPAIDITKSVIEAVTRSYEHGLSRAGTKETPEAVLKKLRFDDGWLHYTNPVAYPTMFQVSQAEKDKYSSEVIEWYTAAKVTPPADLSALWSTHQADLDSLKAAVDATATEWKITHEPCTGWTCAEAQKQVKNAHPKAQIKKSYGRHWVIEKRGVLPVARSMTVQVLFQQPGEPYCQLRAVVLNEDYKGGGKYQRTKRSTWGFVRLQRCK